MTTNAIALVSLACRYPEAATPEALWDNVLAGRRSFRAIPAERIDLTSYAAERVGATDSITRIKAGLLTDWRFDCSRFRIPQPTFEATDLTHWLALEVASEAIERAGGADSLDRDRTVVVVANTLAGEFSRAAMLRLRAPFLDELLADAARKAGADETLMIDLRRRFGEALRERFPAPQEESLAGGLANTIAGRIANYFDFHGGAYVIDAACASSLVALANASDLLVRGDADVAIVGAVDLSLDPFELVGFSRNGALASHDMRVFDVRSAGFWPGEGAGFAVLMRHDNACRRDLPIRATLRGWGISTDGAGGFTRPAVDGQLLAMQRAYARGGVDPTDVGYVEAHGTGTAVGDPVEVRALARLRDGAGTPLAIGSIKANIGHTKAAAGFAGLIKAVAALTDEIVPPHVGCSQPHPVFREVGDRVRLALAAEPWRAQGPLLAGVSGFGFGGINAHIIVERPRKVTRAAAPSRSYRPHDAELFVLAGQSAESVSAQIETLAAHANTMSLAELPDAAAHLARHVGAGPLRVAIVAETPEMLKEGLHTAAKAVLQGHEITGDGQVRVAHRRPPPRIGFLFPGQAAPARPKGDLWARCFDDARAQTAAIPVTPGVSAVDTAVAQPAIACASLAALRLLSACGIKAGAAIGHSLGELTALTWAGGLDEARLVALAAARGAIMARHAAGGGGMLRLRADSNDARRLFEGLDLALACENGRSETVISGPLGAIAIAEERARARNIEATRLSVSHAFHSAMMTPAMTPWAQALATCERHPLLRPVISSVTGDYLRRDEDIAALLGRQLTSPVLFADALDRMQDTVDLVIEVGPGSGLTRLAREAGLTAVSVDAFADTLGPLLSVLAEAFVRGASVRLEPLFADRPVRAFDLGARPIFLASPCGSPLESAPPLAPLTLETPAFESTLPAPDPTPTACDSLNTVRHVIAQEAQFALDAIGDDDRFLADLHLNSLSVARIVSAAARQLGIAAPGAPTAFANATPRELAAALDEIRDLGIAPAQRPDRVIGVRPWVRTYAMRWTECTAIGSDGTIRWQSFALSGRGSSPAAATLAILPADDSPNGALVWIGDDDLEPATPDLFRLCQDIWRDDRIAHLAICHAGEPVAAFARTLAMEGRFTSVRVIERPRDMAVSRSVRKELIGARSGYSEVRITADGRRFEPEFHPATPSMSTAVRAIARDDVILVVGGAKGIGAECALRLAETSNAALVVVGRSNADDPQVIQTLDRAKALRLRCRYLSVDVTKTALLRAALAPATDEFGPVTALVHAAGVNEPKRFIEIGLDDLARTLAPKSDGLRAALDAAGPQLRRVVTFGSLIGRIGLEGEAHYALANAWQSAIAENFAAGHPEVGVLALEWSVWSGAGMGERAGTLERLADRGIDSIALDDALAACERLVQAGATGTIAVTSRFGMPPRLAFAVDLPMLRFVGEPRVSYPGVELVVETELSRGSDLYIDDHRIDGIAVLPGVLGLEAMAQVACALGRGGPPTSIRNVAFLTATLVPDAGTLRLRIAALALDDGTIETVIRAADDAFAAVRMRATFAFDDEGMIDCDFGSPPGELPAVEAGILYGLLLFQGERFRRVRQYDALSARRVGATLSPADVASWFGGFQPQTLLLGDPAVHDATLHALQVCVPHRRVLPVSVDRIAFHSGGPAARIDAIERRAEGDFFTFDIAVRDAAGDVVASWEGATFHAIGEIDVDDVLVVAPQLAATVIERMARAALDEASIEVAIVADAKLSRHQRRARALAALALNSNVFARGDGKPIVVGAEPQTGISLAHRDGMTLAVKATCDVGCDLEFVPADPRTISQALAPSTRPLVAALARDGADSGPVAATRVWAADEATLKRDARPDNSSALHRDEPGRVVSFEGGAGRTTTLRLRIAGREAIVAIGTAPWPRRTLLENIEDRPCNIASGNAS